MNTCSLNITSFFLDITLKHWSGVNVCVCWHETRLHSPWREAYLHCLKRSDTHQLCCRSVSAPFSNAFWLKSGLRFLAYTLLKYYLKSRHSKRMRKILPEARCWKKGSSIIHSLWASPSRISPDFLRFLRPKMTDFAAAVLQWKYTMDNIVIPFLTSRTIVELQTNIGGNPCH